MTSETPSDDNLVEKKTITETVETYCGSKLVTPLGHQVSSNM